MYNLFAMFVTYSFLGWLMEVVFKLIETRKFVNRGFLMGPICPIYGFAGVFTYLILTDFSNNILLLFIMSVTSFAVLEYFSSWALEYLFHTRWWDYSHKKYNINGRICLRNLLFFGIIGCLGVYILNPFVMDIIDMINPSILRIVSCVLLIILILDLIMSIKLVNKLESYLSNVKKDSTEELSNLIKNVLIDKSRYFRRVIFAYPNFKISKEYIIKIKSKITSYSNMIKQLKNKTQKKSK